VGFSVGGRRAGAAMIPIILLHAILLWQQGQATKICDVTLWESGGMQSHGLAAWECSDLIAARVAQERKMQEPIMDGGDVAPLVPASGVTCELATTSRCPPDAPPFDVPPVDTKVIDKNCKVGIIDGRWSECMQYGDDTSHIERACADKSRFLLMSEDGKWHCLALGQQP